MITLIFALYLGVNQPERCEDVRRDHNQFKAWAKSSLEKMQSSPNRTPSNAERASWNEFEKTVEASISELNRRFAHCQEN